MHPARLLAGPTKWVTHANGRSRNVPVNEKGQERQHWLLSAAAVTLSEAQVARMTDDEAYTALEKITFAADDGVPFCLRCGTANAYRLTINRRQKQGVVHVKQYKCRDPGCNKRFTLTSESPLAYRKMSIRDLLYSMSVFTNAASGEASLRLRRAVGCSYKTSFVLTQKIRESLAHSRPKRRLEGVVEVDGTNVGGHYRKGPLKKRGAAQPMGSPSFHRSLVAKRERHPEGITRVGVFPHELAYRDLATKRDFIRDNVVYGSTMISDDGFQLGYIGPTETVNHKQGFKIGGVHNNGVEGYFSRFKRAKRGVYYGFGSPKLEENQEDYLLLYGEEIAWREDYRRKSNGEQWNMMVAAVAHAPRSRRMAGYWTRSRRQTVDGLPVVRRHKVSQTSVPAT